MPAAAAEVVKEAWHEYMSSGAAAAGGQPRLPIEVVADYRRDVVLRWSSGFEQLLPLQLDLPEAVRCLADYLDSGTALALWQNNNATKSRV